MCVSIKEQISGLLGLRGLESMLKYIMTENFPKLLQDTRSTMSAVRCVLIESIPSDFIVKLSKN